ncbi:hypothetical protein C4K27_0895 [Pseudomonas chlororaphis subsp. chlororaphis]|nr:hypothetical protein C4K27_0895 [Pseudomonas chlororaphis subsp. chlororaphis]
MTSDRRHTGGRNFSITDVAEFTPSTPKKGESLRLG